MIGGTVAPMKVVRLENQHIARTDRGMDRINPTQVNRHGRLRIQGRQYEVAAPGTANAPAGHVQPSTLVGILTHGTLTDDRAERRVARHPIVTRITLQYLVLGADASPDNLRQHTDHQSGKTPRTHRIGNSHRTFTMVRAWDPELGTCLRRHGLPRHLL